MEEKISVFKKRKMTFTLIFLVIAILFIGSSIITQYGPIDGITSIPEIHYMDRDEACPERQVPAPDPRYFETAVSNRLLVHCRHSRSRHSQLFS